MVERKFGGSCDERGIRLVGRQAADEVARRLLENDLYVHPSWIDNSPNGVAEAMAIGMPIVSTNVGGIPSLVGDAQQGLLVPPGDPWAMAGAIRRLADDPELADRLAAGARETAARRHDPASVAETLVGIYRQILSP